YTFLTSVCSAYQMSPFSPSLLRASSARRIPCTTLFRSYVDVEAKLWPAPVEDIWGIGSRMKENLKRMGINRLGQLAHTKRSTLKDRKSTRLNSSHVAISYAVFCLKKKNIQTQADKTRQK